MSSASTIWQVYTDGASKGNPGPASLGFVIKNNHGVLIEKGKCIGLATNNVAEYSAVIEAIKTLRNYSDFVLTDRVELFSDSQLVIFQILGHYKVRHPDLFLLKSVLDKLLVGLNISVKHIRRELNTRADALANLALKSAHLAAD